MVYGADNKLLYMLTPEGMVSRSEGSSGSTYTYNYFVKDHIGSTRVVLAAVGDTLQEIQSTDYYPFGLAHSTNNLNKNKYLFSGKEFQDGTLGGSMLGLYDFGARFYDPMLGRWLSQDPMRQFLSPYLYCANNPVNLIDPSGTYAVKDSVADGEGGWIYFMTWTELQGITVRPNSYPGWSPDYSTFFNDFNHGYWGQGVDVEVDMGGGGGAAGIAEKQKQPYPQGPKTPVIRNRIETKLMDRNAALRKIYIESYYQGTPWRENAFFRLKNGLILFLPNNENSSTGSTLPLDEVEIKNGKMYHERYDDSPIVEVAHTHPTFEVKQGIGVSDSDVYRMQQIRQYNADFTIIYNRTIYQVWGKQNYIKTGTIK